MLPPIVVREALDADGERDLVLVSGAHRREARDAPRVRFHRVRCDRGQRCRRETLGNRGKCRESDLSHIERADLVGLYVKLSEQQQKVGVISAQSEPKIAKDGTKRGRPESSLNRAARELHINNLSNEAPQFAKMRGLDKKKELLLAAAGQPTAEEQLAYLQAEERKRRERDARLHETLRKKRAQQRAAAWVHPAPPAPAAVLEVAATMPAPQPSPAPAEVVLDASAAEPAPVQPE